MGGAYGLDIVAVLAVADRLDIETDRLFFEKLIAWEAEVLAVMKEREGKEEPVRRCDDARKVRCEFEFGDNLEWACGECKEIRGGK